MHMTRENKLALVVAFGLILLVGVLISDHFSAATNSQSADLSQGRADDPLAKRQSDPVLIDLQARNRKSSAETLRSTPLAMSTGQVENETPEQDNSQANGSRNVQRVVMGEPVPNTNQHNETPSHELGSPDTPVTFHNVRSGETLTAITQRYYGDASLVDELARFNDLSDVNNVRVNHRLRIPAREVLAGRPNSDALPPDDRAREQPVYTSYTVKKGDTLSELSMELLGTSRRWRELYELNDDVIDDPDNLIAGTTLKVPRPG